MFRGLHGLVKHGYVADFSAWFGLFAVHVEGSVWYHDSFVQDGFVGVCVDATKYVEHDRCGDDHGDLFGNWVA